MSEEEKKAEGEPEVTPEALKNLKSELDRKLSNIEQQATQAQQQLLQQLQSMNAAPPAPAAAVEGEKLSDLMYSDPDKYTQIIQERATAAATAVANTRVTEQTQLNVKYAELTASYPEIQDAESPLSVRAREIISGYGDGAVSNPALVESAVYRAAAETGLKPRSKRESNNNDSFALKSPGTSSRNAAGESADAEIDDVMRFWAKVGKVDLKDEKVKARIIANKAKMKNGILTSQGEEE